MRYIDIVYPSVTEENDISSIECRVYPSRQVRDNADEVDKAFSELVPILMEEYSSHIKKIQNWCKRNNVSVNKAVRKGAKGYLTPLTDNKSINEWCSIINDNITYREDVGAYFQGFRPALTEDCKKYLEERLGREIPYEGHALISRINVPVNSPFSWSDLELETEREKKIYLVSIISQFIGEPCTLL